MKTIVAALAGSSLIALATPAFAQSASAAAQNQPPADRTAPNPAAASGGQSAPQDIVVTGSRIISNGFDAPTPVTTLSQEALETRAPSNIPDALNQLPQFRGSLSNSTSVTWDSSSPNQGNYLNLRGLGTQRSLILLDGKRVPPTSFDGGVDINTLPQDLVQRVDVVTGGASAAYGSDAVVGVVNFVLDKNFNGVKGEINKGISTYGDDPSTKATLAAGTGFAGGRGHVEVSASHYFSGGIHNIGDRSAQGGFNGAGNIITVGLGTTAVPTTTAFNTRFLKMSTGGTIDSGPLNGYQFLPDGTIQPMDVGEPTSQPDTYRVGGSGGYYKNTWLTSQLQTDRVFGRVSYDLLDALTAHVQVSASQAKNKLGIRYDERFPGTATQLTIFRDNAYLLPSVAAAMGDTDSFTLGRISLDTPQYVARTKTKSINIDAGFDGKFQLFGNDWHWDAGYIYGRTHLRTQMNEFNNQRYYAAVDSVIDPATGDPTCRVTLTNPGLMPGCVPMNVLGTGAPSQEAVDYVMGLSRYTVVNKENIADLDFSGALFDLPAGPVSIAFGGEYRTQSLDERSTSDPSAASQVDYTGIRGAPDGVLISDFTNVGSARGKINVKEAYVELEVPILKNKPLFESLSLNGAARVTDYSTSGTVVTWKAGVSYAPVHSLRFRSTISRDIAAPSLYDLFAGDQVQNRITTDSHTSTQGFLIQHTKGNPDLDPEKGTMFVAGAVYSPTWLDGMTLSVDYYHLKIKDAIGTVGSGTLFTNCDLSNGTSPICDNIIRPYPYSDRSPENFPTAVILQPENQAAIVQSGIDVQTNYRLPLDRLSSSLGNGVVTLESYLSFGLEGKSKDTPLADYRPSLGIGHNPKVSGSFSASYANGGFSTQVTERFTGKTKRSSRDVEGTYGVYATYGNEPNVWYTDLNIAYNFKAGGLVDVLGGGNFQLFLNVKNLFNQKPPLVADCCNPGLQFPTDRGKYDVIGRFFTVGARFRF